MLLEVLVVACLYVVRTAKPRSWTVPPLKTEALTLLHIMPADPRVYSVRCPLMNVRALDLSFLLRNSRTSNHLNRLFLDFWYLDTNSSQCLRPRATLTVNTEKQVCFTNEKGKEKASRSPYTNHRRTKK